MELVKRNLHMENVRCKASTQITMEDDVIISDSRPDAVKLIMDKGNVTLEEVKVTADHVNVKGRLDFQVLYLTEPSSGQQEGGVDRMQGSIPFEEMIFMEGVQNGGNVETDWEIEDLTVGLINSRKFSVQALLNLSFVCRELSEEETAVDLYSQEPVEFRKKPLEIAALAVRKKDIFRIKEEVEIPGSFPNILSVIWSEIEPEAVEFKVMDDKLSLQGELRLFFLYRGEGEKEELCHYETTLPFTGSLECPGCAEGMLPQIRYQAENREVEVRPDFDGEERVISFEQCLNLDISVYEEENIEILADVYGVTKEIAVAEKDTAFKKLLCKSSGKTKISGHFRGQEENALYRILHTASSLKLEEEKVVEGGIELSGTLELQILCETGNEAEKYSVVRGSIPFAYVLEAEGISPNCGFTVEAFVEQITAAIIDNEEADVKCMLYFRANIYEEWQEKIVEQIQVSEPDAEKMAALPGIAIYMVKERESLWDIGKRYYVPVAAIRQTNNLTSDEVKAGDKLLIVKGW